MNGISVIVPAHDEEQFIGRCLDSIATAARHVPLPVETVVVLNRCTDRTEEVARQAGAQIVIENARCLARIRNAGVAVAAHEVIVTIDADSWMTPKMLREVLRLLASGRYVGGGVWIHPERISLGILMSCLLILPTILRERISAGLFWLTKRDFDCIRGFDEKLVCVEDIDFARRLRAHGRATGRRFGTIWRERIYTSCRKFDGFGDWYLFRNPGVVRRLLSGHDREAADEFYYDFRR